MANYYCTIEDVLDAIPEHIPTDGLSEDANQANSLTSLTIPASTVDTYIRDACASVNAKLSSRYEVPLAKKNQGGVVTWPVPISDIAVALAASSLKIKLVFSPEVIDLLSRRRDWAVKKLDAIANGEVTLIGSKRRSSRFIRAGLEDIAKPSHDQLISRPWTCQLCGVRTLMTTTRRASDILPGPDEGGPCYKAPTHDHAWVSGMTGGRV